MVYPYDAEFPMYELLKIVISAPGSTLKFFIWDFKASIVVSVVSKFVFRCESSGSYNKAKNGGRRHGYQITGD